MRNQRNFGVEIECDSNGLGTQGVRHILRNNGFSNWAENIYHDGSDVEIPSPILSGSKGLSELKSVMNLLKKHGCSTTSADGMHVHHDVKDLNLRQIHTIAETWMINQPLIHSLVDVHRVANRWCRDLRREDLVAIENEIKLPPVPNARYEHDKYKSLSVASRVDYGTLEIRLHEGTLDFEKARGWILFGQAFITNIAKMKKPVKYTSVEEMLVSTKVYKVGRETLLKRIHA